MVTEYLHAALVPQLVENLLGIRRRHQIQPCD